ncbi:MAG: helix-turn-helix domain-containing protein [Caulobacteraceae bacterium]
MSEAARRSMHESRGLKARAMNAAAQILAEEGLAALSLRAIAELAGVGIASIYHYFAGKDELLAALAVDGFQRLERDMSGADAIQPAPSAIGRGAQAFFAFTTANPALFALMFDVQMMSRHAELREAEDRAFVAFAAYVAKDDRIDADYAPAVASTLWALGRGIAAIASSQPGGQLNEAQSALIFGGANYLLQKR